MIKNIKAYVCYLKVYNILVSMNSITIFRQFFSFNVKKDYTIIGCEMFCISFNLRHSSINIKL